MFASIDQIKEANRQAGKYYFSPATLQFFNARVEDGVYGGRYFVTSERPPQGTRAWSVREVSEDGAEISTADGTMFMEYATSEDAHAAARKLAGQTVH